MIEIFPEALIVKVKCLVTLVTALILRLFLINSLFLFIILNHESYLSRLRLVPFT